MIKMAVIGVGAMGRNHVRVSRELEHASLVAVADCDRSRVEKSAAQYGTRPYVDYRQMLDRERPDMVCIAVPTRLHTEVALEALARGIHVLLEKPLAPTVKEGRQIIDEARSRKLKLMVGHVERFNPAVLELKKRLERDELGKVFQVSARRLSSFPKRITDAGVAIDLATHDLDLMRYFVAAKVARVYAEIASQSSGAHEDLVFGLLRFANGVVGAIEVNWLTPAKVRDLSIIGEKGRFLIDYLSQDLTFYENSYAGAQWESWEVFKGVGEGNITKFQIERVEPLRAELQAFVEAVEDDAEPRVSGEDALQAVMLADMLIESGKNHKAISLEVSSR